MEANEIEKKIKALPDDLKKEVIDYIDFLIMKKKKSNKQTGGFNFSWEGGLAELRKHRYFGFFTSLNWRNIFQ